MAIREDPRRVTDYALIIGHVWRCTACCADLLADPQTTWIGYKLSETQRECILGLDDDVFQTATRLAEVTGLSVDELYAAIDHPRARLRHLGSVKGEAYDRSFR